MDGKPLLLKVRRQSDGKELDNCTVEEAVAFAKGFDTVTLVYFPGQILNLKTGKLMDVTK